MQLREARQKPGLTGLVLPGGGARGAYQVGVLAGLVELCQPDVPTFPVVCGTSAGAVNAVVLASHAHDLTYAVERLASFWSQLHCARIYRTDAFTVLASSLRWFLALVSGGLLPVAPRSLLDNAPLRALLEDALRLERIETAIKTGALRGTAVTAAAYTRASAISFFAASPDVGPWTRNRRRGERTRLHVDHIMASVALPMLFPAQRIGTEFYGDGGMRSVAPLSPAIHLGADRILVIATRDERPDPAPAAPAAYPGAGEVGGYLLDTVFMDTLNADLARLERINRTLSLMRETQRAQTGLKLIETLVLRPSRDLREVTAEHAASMPASVKLLLRTLGGWGRDWRMASYLLFEASYCKALMDLGREDALRSAVELREFFGLGPGSADRR
ncbi:MAG: patatin-like phospholipase family protein [Pseudomonadota bacterium]